MRRYNAVAFHPIALPDEYDRAQLALRIAFGALLGMVGLSFGALALFVYVALPVAVSMFVSRDDTHAFASRDAPVIERWLRWMMAASAYFALVTDRFPVDRANELVTIQVHPAAIARPTVGSALLRLAKTLPGLAVWALLCCIGSIVWLIAAVSILFRRRYATGLRTYMIGVLRYQACLLAYHASLVDAYPPFELDDPHASAART